MRKRGFLRRTAAAGDAVRRLCNYAYAVQTVKRLTVTPRLIRWSRQARGSRMRNNFAPRVIDGARVFTTCFRNVLVITITTQ